MTKDALLPSSKTIAISATRFEQSPFYKCYAESETTFGVYAGRFYPSSNGEDVEQMYWTLRRKSVLYDVPERPLEISGPDAAVFLDHVLACHVGTLQQGRGRYALACTPQGGLFMDGILFRLAEDRFWYVQPDGALETWLVAHSGRFNVNISDPKSRVLQIQGPTSLDVINAATRGAVDQNFKYFHSGFFKIGGQRVYISRTGWTGELGVEVYTMGPETDCTRLWRDLFQAGLPHGMSFGTIASMNIRRIEAGIFDNQTDFDWSMTPEEAGLERFISMDKRDFIGKRALLASRKTLRVHGVKCPNTAVSKGDSIFAGKDCIGQASSGTWSPYLSCGIGIVRLSEPGHWFGTDLSLRNGNDEEQHCRIVPLPFFDRNKDIARGLSSDIP